MDRNDPPVKYTATDAPKRPEPAKKMKIEGDRLSLILRITIMVIIVYTLLHFFVLN